MSDYYTPEPAPTAEPAAPAAENPWEGHPEFEAAVEQQLGERLDEWIADSFDEGDERQPAPDDAEAWQLLERVTDEQALAEGELEAVGVLGELGVADDKLEQALQAADDAYRIFLSKPEAQQLLADDARARGITAEQMLAELAVQALHVAAEQHVSPPPGMDEVGLAQWHAARPRFVRPTENRTSAERQAASSAAREAGGDEVALAKAYVSALGGRGR